MAVWGTYAWMVEVGARAAPAAVEHLLVEEVTDVVAFLGALDTTKDVLRIIEVEHGCVVVRRSWAECAADLDVGGTLGQLNDGAIAGGGERVVAATAGEDDAGIRVLDLWREACVRQVRVLTVRHARVAAHRGFDALHEVHVEQKVERAIKWELEVGVLEAARGHDVGPLGAVAQAAKAREDECAVE